MTNDYSFATLRNRLRVTGTLVALTALRIGSGRSTEVTGTDLPVLRDARGRPLIPGASIKGALRSRMESLVRVVNDDEALDLPALQDKVGDLAKLLEHDADLKRLRAKSNNAAAVDQYTSTFYWKHSTLIDLTFGAQWTASRVFVRDALVDTSLWFGQYEVRNGVGIDRDTETASDGLLYDYEVVPAGTRFDFALSAENMADWQLGMLVLALAPWERGEAQVGGFRSRGLGYVQLVAPKPNASEPVDPSEPADKNTKELPRYDFFDIRSKNKVDDVINLLDGKGGTAMTDTQRKEWIAAFKVALENPSSVKGN